MGEKHVHSWNKQTKQNNSGNDQLTVTTTFHQELFHGTSLGRRKERFASIGIIKGDFSVGSLDVVNKGRLFKVATVLSKRRLRM